MKISEKGCPKKLGQPFYFQIILIRRGRHSVRRLIH